MKAFRTFTPTGLMQFFVLLLLAFTNSLTAIQITDRNNATNSSMYNTFAADYDQLYQTKNYKRECAFLHALFSKHQIRTILDVGCGTGTHLEILEQFDYRCEGLDFHDNMIEIAKKKLQGRVVTADMRTFEFHQNYDAIISLFAVFNHNLTLEDARKTLAKLKSHLKRDGILILDLHNPQYSGEKANSSGDITKVMQWDLAYSNNISVSTVSFFKREQKLCEEKFFLKIYSISEMEQLLKEAGFTRIQVYNDFNFEIADAYSKNLVFVAQ